MIKSIINCIDNKDDNLIIVDIGTSDSSHSVEFYKHFPNSKIYLYECKHICSFISYTYSWWSIFICRNCENNRAYINVSSLANIRSNNYFISWLQSIHQIAKRFQPLDKLYTYIYHWSIVSLYWAK